MCCTADVLANSLLQNASPSTRRPVRALRAIPSPVLKVNVDINWTAFHSGSEADANDWDTLRGYQIGGGLRLRTLRTSTSSARQQRRRHELVHGEKTKNRKSRAILARVLTAAQ